MAAFNHGLIKKLRAIKRLSDIIMYEILNCHTFIVAYSNQRQYEISDFYRWVHEWRAGCICEHGKEIK